MAMNFQIITPDKTALTIEVEHVYFPGSLGETGVLPQHTALITVMKPGILRYKPVGQDEVSVVVGDGYVQVQDNRILMVTDIWLEDAEIDEHSVEEAIATAQQALKERENMSKEDHARFEANLAKQIAILNFKKRKHMHGA